MPTFNSVQATLGGLTVTDVTTVLTYPPDQVNVADMPIMFPQVPEGEAAIGSFSGGSDLDRMTMELIVVIGPSRQNTAQANFNKTVDIMDNLNTVLKTEQAANQEIDGWSWGQRMLTYQSADGLKSTDYYAIVATVRFS